MPPDPGMRLAPAGNSIGDGVDAWLSNLAARGKRANTIVAYRALLTSSAPLLGWRTVQDISPESLSDWMGARRESGEWKGVTLNRNLSAFKSLTLFLTRNRWLASDPLACMDRAEDDGAEGSRAATTDEARAMLRFAWERQQLDRRCKGDRALVWLSCFTMGLRFGEAEKLRWSHVLLDEPIPLTRWTKDIQKNRKQQEVALPPELVPMLRAHRERVPHAPADPLFPIAPPRHTFNTDRNNAGIAAADSRGRTLSSHGMRKWLATTLTAQNVHSRVIDRILRHAGGVQARYAEISLEDQVSALNGLPRLHPENRESWVRNSVDRLTAAPDDLGVTFATLSNSASPPRPAAALRTSQTHDARRAGDSEFNREDGSGNSGGSTQRLGTDPVSDAVADLLDAAARLLRSRGRDDRQ